MFYSFDLLWLNGEDLRQLPLIERKTRLARLVELKNPGYTQAEGLDELLTRQK